MRNLKSNYQYFFIGLLIVIFVCFAFIVALATRYYYVQTAEERLDSELRMVEAFLLDESWEKASFQRIINSQDFYDLTLISEEKDVVTTVKKEYKEHFISNLQHEIQTDMNSNIRVNDKYVVYFKGIKSDGDTVVISTKVELIHKTTIQIYLVVSLIFVLLFAFTLLLVSRFNSVIDQTLTESITVANSFLRGDFKARMTNSPFRKTNELAFTVNELALSMSREKKKQNLLNDRLSALVENIGSGILVIEKDGKINFVNKIFTNTFFLKQKEVMDRFYDEVISHQEINEIIEQVFLKEKNVKRQVPLQLKAVTKYFQIYGVPVISKNGLWEGIVLVFHDISEMKKLEQMRKDFVANVSHELRTPITSIKGFAETLLDGAKNDPQTLESFLHIIYKESDRLQILVQDLLELSRIETNKLELSYSKVLINDLIDECLFLMEPRAKSKNITTIFHQTEICMIEVDYNRIKQVLVNLLTNAVNYCKENGSITVELRKQKENVTMVIKDTGIGMEEEELPRIFERFYRIDRARNRDSGGTGLGLAIVKHLIEAHHGSISVSSKVNVGTTFTITLPITNK